MSLSTYNENEHVISVESCGDNIEGCNLVNQVVATTKKDNTTKIEIFKILLLSAFKYFIFL